MSSSTPALVPWPSFVADKAGAPHRFAVDPAIEERADAPGHGDEGYALRVTADGVRIEASAAAGAFYARRTLDQLIDEDADGRFIRPIEIRDAPRFAYRGMMLDVARHFHPVETVEAVIDRIASLKLNHLHLHLSDDQGWRLHISARPNLAAVGATTSMFGGPGGFYTRDDYRRIVRYAAERHITVVPEFDLPGHTHALGLAYPELVHDPVITDAVREITAAHGGELPRRGEPYTGFAVGFSSLRAHDDRVAQFLDEVLGELAQLTPGPYLHIGGDEAHGTDPDDYAALVRLAAGIVAKHGKTPVAWHEAGTVDGLPHGMVGQYWGFIEPQDGNAEKARGFVRAGGRLILSPADAIYLDIKYDEHTELGQDWAREATSIERSYRWEPAEIIDGITEHDILGVEAPLWTETIPDPAAIDAMTFPRVGSAADAGWSARAGSVPERTWESFRERLAGLAPAWERAGIGFTRAEGVDWPARVSA